MRRVNGCRPIHGSFPPDVARDPSGNSHGIKHSFFSLSEFFQGA